MGAALAHNRPQKQLCDILEEVVRVLAAEWVSLGKLAKLWLPANIATSTVYLDARGVIHFDYLWRGIIDEYYNFFIRTRIPIKTNQGEERALSPRQFKDANVGSHFSLTQWIGLRIFLHSPYSLDLVPREYYLVPNLNKWLDGKSFGYNEEIMVQTNAYFEDLGTSCYLENREIFVSFQNI